MAEYYTIQPADDSVPIDPRDLRELQDLLSEDEDLDLSVRLTDRPPAPGEQGALPIALEIVATATPLATAFAGVLAHWINSHKVRIKVRHGDDSIEVSAGNIQDAERLIAKMVGGSGAAPDDDD
jgi:hypothetical protein